MVAQIFNLPYRRLAVGWRPARPSASGCRHLADSKSAVRQSATLRYAESEHRLVARSATDPLA
jgi:hypothetical protein